MQRSYSHGLEGNRTQEQKDPLPEQADRFAEGAERIRPLAAPYDLFQRDRHAEHPRLVHQKLGED
jgi:hypothetical protein